MTTPAMETKIKANLDEIRELLGEKSWDTAYYMAETLRKRLTDDKKFTGKIVFTVNCRNGGVGNTEAFIQKKI